MQARVHDDLPVLRGLLDHADVPVTMEAFAKALDGTVTVGDREAPAQTGSQRARNAVAHLQSKGLTRCINMKNEHTGYVWNDRGLSDSEWKARIADPPMSRTVPPVRVEAPGAVVVVVGRGLVSLN